MKAIILTIIILVCVTTVAQKKDFNLPDGNENFAKKEYANAEANYRISKSNHANRATAYYNLGNAIYRQKQPTEAKYAFAKSLEKAKGKQQKHRASHNLGNALMNEKNYAQAIEAYKNALRNNPDDEESRYNLALAKKMQKENPEKKKDKKDKDKDKDKDKKDEPKEDKKDKPKEGEDKKDDKGNPNQDQQNNKPPQQKQGVSKDRIQNLLEAVNNEEKKIQDKINGNKVKGKPVDNEKDW